MSRVKSGTITHARHKKIIKAAKGYYGRRSNPLELLPKLLIKQTNMQPVIVKHEKGHLELYGFNASMQL